MEVLLDFDEIPPQLIEYFEPINEGSQSSVWQINTQPYKNAHFATFPSEIPKRCILAATSEKGNCGAIIKKLRLKQNLPPEKMESALSYLKRKHLIE